MRSFTFWSKKNCMKYTFICHTLDYGWRSTMGWWFSCTLQFFQAWFVIYCMMVCSLTNTITYKKININLLFFVRISYLINIIAIIALNVDVSMKRWEGELCFIQYETKNQYHHRGTYIKEWLARFKSVCTNKHYPPNIFPITLLSNKSWFSIVCNKRWPGATQSRNLKWRMGFGSTL